jgi:GWxTD domain-containing protein
LVKYARFSVNMQSQRSGLFYKVLALSLLLALALASGIAQAGQKNKNKNKDGLEKNYSDWLNRDVAYIITKQERKAFLVLTSDDARDDFIERFWAIRNPDPGSPANTYKDEIYERIAYADAHFGVGSGGQGWRSDRGRTYITLGAPQQISKYYGAPNLRPIEIWFYSSINPALPSFFYVMFYQPNSMGEFEYYSPYMDGPDKLVTGMEAINDPQSALKLIQSSVGPEVARIAQTLIPSEPLDPDGRIGLQSDMMLSTLRNLANTPYNLEELDRRRGMSENVTAQLIVNANRLDMVVLPVRDARGLTRLDYAVRLRDPGDLTLTKGEDGHYTYAIEVRVRVLTADKQLVFTQQKAVSGSLDQRGLDEIEHRPFGYQGILPLPPGKYHLDFLITDWTKQVGYHGERDVEIPGNTATTFVIPALLPFSVAERVDPAKDGTIPFGIAGVRFKPLETSPLLFNPDTYLNVAYQIWAPPKDPQQGAGQSLLVEYAFGEPAASNNTTVLKDTVDMGEFTSSGALVNGKKISLFGKPEGNYLLTVSVSHPGTPQKAYSSLSFQISGDVAAEPPWDVDAPEIDTDLAKGVFDLDRALCYLAQDNAGQARIWFRLALSKDHGDDIARAHLVQAYYTLNAYPAVVSLFNDAGVTDHTEPGTITQIAESFLKTGNTSKAVSLLQDAIRTSPEDGPLYLALADCYQQMGKQQEALEMVHKGQSLLTTGSSAK